MTMSLPTPNLGYSRLQKVGIWMWDVLGWFSFFYRLWGWRTVIFQLSGFCIPTLHLPDSSPLQGTQGAHIGRAPTGPTPEPHEASSPFRDASHNSQTPGKIQNVDLPLKLYNLCHRSMSPELGDFFLYPPEGLGYRGYWEPVKSGGPAKGRELGPATRAVAQAALSFSYNPPLRPGSFVEKWITGQI